MNAGALPADVRAELEQHRLGLPVVHDDYQHALCACASAVVSAPPANPGLPDGGICFRCGGMTVRTGTCTTCTGCGETGGCG